jgi:dienelactone hydrolase
MYRRGYKLLIGLLLSLLACSRREPPPETLQPQEISLKTVDGVTLGATLYPIKQPSPPGIVFVHMEGSDRRSWTVFAKRAQMAGYFGVTFDMRGHADSRKAGDATLSYGDFSAQDWLNVLADIEAAANELVKQGVNAQNITVAGAGVGGSLALHYALERTDIAAVLMVSPGLDYKGVKTADAIKAYGKRPSLLISSEGDSYSVSSGTSLKAASEGLCELREYPGSAHGTNLLDGSNAAQDDAILWLQPIMGRPHGAQDPTRQAEK